MAALKTVAALNMSDFASWAAKHHKDEEYHRKIAGSEFSGVDYRFMMLDDAASRCVPKRGHVIIIENFENVVMGDVVTIFIGDVEFWSGVCGGSEILDVNKAIYIGGGDLVNVMPLPITVEFERSSAIAIRYSYIYLKEEFLCEMAEICPPLFLPDHRGKVALGRTGVIKKEHHEELRKLRQKIIPII